MKIKQLFLGASFALFAGAAFAQPTEVTDAAMAYNAAQSAFMTQKFERYVEKVVEGKKAIDIAAASEEGKTHPKTYQYLTQLDMELSMAIAVAGQMKIENSDLEEYKKNSDNLAEETKAAYLKCKALDTKKKRHIKELNEYMEGKLSMLNNQARMAFEMRMFDGAFAGFISCSGIAKMIGHADSTGLDKNAKISFARYADTLQKTDTEEKGLPMYKLANTAFSDDEFIFETYVKALMKLKKDDEAKKVMAESAKNNPNNINILYNIGVIYDQSYSEEEGGIEILTEAVKNNPENEHLNYLTGMSLYNKGAVFYKEFQGAEETDPKKGELKKKAQEIFTKAIPYFENAREKHASKKKIAGKLYKIYQVNGNKEKADEMKAIFMAK